MRIRSTRPTLRAAAALVAVAAIALTPVAADAATQSVGMDYARVFHPATLPIAPGDTVKWTNSRSEHHDVDATRPQNLFMSPGGVGGMHLNATYSYTFTSAGSYRYVCLAHSADGMKGTIVVPIRVSRIAGSPERFRVNVGSVALPSSASWVRIVQVKVPGTGSSWKTFRTTRAASVTYTPATAGTYRFQSFLKSTGGGGFSDPSPTASISH